MALFDRLKKAAKKAATVIGTPGARIVQAAVPDLRPSDRPEPSQAVQAAAQIARIPFLPAEAAARVITRKQRTQRLKQDMDAQRDRERRESVKRLQRQQKQEEQDAARRIEREIQQQEQEATKRIEQEVQRQEQSIMDQLRNGGDPAPAPPAPTAPTSPQPPNDAMITDGPLMDSSTPTAQVGSTETVEAPGFGTVAVIGAAALGGFLLLRGRN